MRPNGRITASRQKLRDQIRPSSVNVTMPIRQLRDRSMSLDIYVWLAWRLHRLDKSTKISWPAIHGQFGNGFRAIRQFKPRFAEALAAAVAAYPDARVDISDAGVTLHPARPPIARIA